ncbi:energy transducer TonB [Solidesulfovibrio alcoholivorans]|uniref:energy transducer TonB n=1 Tax=Solidesulfovibrio alcoholivorans TaxID=81406 RepID=UPI0004969B88|nr:energy transducer TonB [Solidesulfovibrio alcoholivorans]
MKTASPLPSDRQSCTPRAWGALAVSALAHGLAVVAMAAMCGPASCPPVMPRIVLTAALAPAGYGSGPAGPASAAAEPAAAPEPVPAPPEPEESAVETIAAATQAPAPVVASEEPVPPKPVVKPKPVARPRPVVKRQKPAPEPAPRETAAAAAALADPGQTGAGGGSGAASGPPLPSGGGAGPGSIGSPLSAGDLDNQPALVFSPKPEYPMQAKRRGLKGRLRVRLLVDRVGKVERVDILGGENVDSFAESVRATLSRWRFKPGTQKGTPVHWVAILPIAFEQE